MGLAPLPLRAAPAIFAARNNALLFGLGAIVGAWRLLGRGRGLAGASAFGAAPPSLAVLVALAAPFVVLDDLRTAAADLEMGAVDGRGPGRVVVAEVVREMEGRGAAGWTDAADGGRGMTGRAVDVPLKDCREEEREGTDCPEAWRTEVGRY